MSQKIITIPTGDTVIWDRDRVVADISYCMATDTDFMLDMLNEGPCLTSLGLYTMLDMLCEKFNYPKEKVSIVNLGNQLETHKFYRVETEPTVKWIERYQTELKLKPTEYKIFNDSTKHFGHFVGHGTRNRLLIGSTLYTKYKDKTLQTYHCCVNDEYHKASIFFDDLMFSGAPLDNLDYAYNFLTRATPIKLDSLDKIETYPIRDHTMFGIAVAYPMFFVDIVCQTYCRGTTFYIDEKMWRPIMTKTPFIIQGPQNFLKNLHRLGFKSFKPYWKESYSESPWNEQPYQILEIIEEISKLSVRQMIDMYESMKPTLDYNYEKFMNLSKKDFENFRIQ